MDFDYSPKVRELRARVTQFMQERVYPNEGTFFTALDAGPSRWVVPPIMETLKEEAKAAGLWNLFLPDSEHGAGLSNPRVRSACRDHGPLADRAGGV